ncbi:DUF722 domain-containing protein [Clostridium paraputrificum]|uniref:DUF722 domain-containing protein n=1 Tax=Clostridium paraputrificum TaxID=29363 RepID=UPI00189812D0|nr:DUF722 domain-containing protein [Clostridium paraputrificum]MDC0803505.1 DUF722 domain-containing protein [Clostridium paraputrificum]
MDNSFKETEYKLYNYKDIVASNKVIDIKIKILENDISCKGITYDEKSAPTNAFHSDTESEVIRREKANVYDKINRLKEEKERNLITKELIDAALEVLEPSEKKLVQLRYFSKPKNSWNSVAIDMNLSVERCVILRRGIIAKLSKLINI